MPKTHVAAGALTFVLGIVLLFPARVAYDWFAPEPVRLSGIEGSVWSGTAASASAGPMYISNLHWRMQPLKLFLARLGFVIDGEIGGGTVDGTVAVGAGGAISLSDLTATLPLGLFTPLVNLPGLGGTATVALERLRLEDGLPTAADGTVEVRGLLIPAVDPSPIGGYRAEFFTEDDAVVASVEDTDGVLDVAGELRVNADRSYRFLGLIAETNDTPQKIRQQLRMLGSPNERGQRELRLEGSL